MVVYGDIEDLDPKDFFSKKPTKRIIIPRMQDTSAGPAEYSVNAFMEFDKNYLHLLSHAMGKKDSKFALHINRLANDLAKELEQKIVANYLGGTTLFNHLNGSWGCDGKIGDNHVPLDIYKVFSDELTKEIEPAVLNLSIDNFLLRNNTKFKDRTSDLVSTGEEVEGFGRKLFFEPKRASEYECTSLYVMDQTCFDWYSQK